MNYIRSDFFSDSNWSGDFKPLGVCRDSCRRERLTIAALAPRRHQSLSPPVGPMPGLAPWRCASSRTRFPCFLPIGLNLAQTWRILGGAPAEQAAIGLCAASNTYYKRGSADPNRYARAAHRLCFGAHIRGRTEGERGWAVTRLRHSPTPSDAAPRPMPRPHGSRWTQTSSLCARVSRPPVPTAVIPHCSASPNSRPWPSSPDRPTPV
jgi:hypothetical protein